MVWGCGGGAYEVLVVVGHCICKREPGEGGWGAKNLETEREGSVSGVPHETMVEGNEGMW